MQCLASECFDAVLQLCGCALVKPQSSSIDIITNNWMSNVSHMYSNLMSSTRFQFQAQMTVAVKTVNNLIVGSRLFTITDNCHLSTLFGMPAHRLIYRTSSNNHTSDNRFIFSPDRSCLQLRNQIGVRLQCLGHYH